MIRPFACLVAFLILLVSTARLVAVDTKADTQQVAAVREMQKVLKDREWERFYRDYCHPQLQKQLDAKAFQGFMDSEEGKAVVELFDQVLKAVDTKADKTVLIAQPQEDDDQYEFILVNVKETGKAERKGQQWHLELKRDEGKWKLLDTD